MRVITSYSIHYTKLYEIFLPFYARLVDSAQEFVEVDFLKGQTIRLGERRFEVSILTTKLPGSDVDAYFVHCPRITSYNVCYTKLLRISCPARSPVT